MDVQLLTIDSLRQDLRTLSRTGFAERYPGAFLLALGFLSVSEIDAKRRRHNAKGERCQIDETTSFSFAPNPKHDAASSHPLAGCAFYLKPGGEQEGLTVGRSKGCEVTVPDNGVSERHCRIEIHETGVVVVDCGSTNGTAINLSRLPANQPKTLADEDILSVGRYSFQMLTSPTFYTELQPLAFEDGLDE